MSKKNIILLTILSVYLLIQFIPVDRTNPESDPDLKISAPPEVMTILQKSCFDCHSNETKWPFYSFNAPFSWLVSRDVIEGRKHLNFSEWGKMPVDKQERKKKHIQDEVDEGGMPLPVYLLMHSDAKLTESDKQIIKNWTDSANKATEDTPK
jgi:hypothetical protein